MTLAADVARLRAFNRFFTARIGVLLDHPYDERFTLAQTRVLFELAHADSIQPTALARDLGLDLGYLSRILARFRQLKLISREADPNDGRSARFRLTAKGRATFAPIDRASQEQVAALLRPLSPEARRSLLDGAGSVQEALGQQETRASQVRLRELRVGDIGWITHRQALLYHQEYGWDLSYEALVAEILGCFARSYDPARERAWIGEQDGEIVGSVFLVKGDAPEVAKLRLLYVEPAARGHGIGRRLVDACIESARAFGYARLTLWTNDVLVAACRIYQAAGFKLVSEERHHSFGQDLVGQTWTLDF